MRPLRPAISARGYAPRGYRSDPETGQALAKRISIVVQSVRFRALLHHCHDQLAQMFADTVVATIEFDAKRARSILGECVLGLRRA